MNNFKTICSERNTVRLVNVDLNRSLCSCVFSDTPSADFTVALVTF